MAHRTTLSQERPMQTAKEGDQERNRIFDAFRRWGYLEARLDPLGIFEPLKHPDLEGLSGELAEEARRIYCGTIGADFMHLAEPERRRWIIERIEAPAEKVDPHKILERLIRADLFEQVLQARYLGSKRFSLDRKSTRLNSSHSQISYAVF